MNTVRFYSDRLFSGLRNLTFTSARFAIGRMRLLLGAMALVFGISLTYAASEGDASKNIVPARHGVQVPPGYTGIGPVIAGSVDYSSIPAKSRKFLEHHCDGHAIVKCEKEFASGEYEIGLADGIEIEFDSKGNIKEIEAPDGYSLSPKLLRAVVPGKLYHLLEHNGFRDSVEAVHHSRNGYRLSISDPVFDSVCFDNSGVFTLVVDE